MESEIDLSFINLSCYQNEITPNRLPFKGETKRKA
jgi:hypothetical protein